MKYSAEEVFNIGVEIEKNGFAFYTAAAAKTKDDEGKRLLLELAAWEKNHVTIFENLKIDMPANLKSGEDLFDLDGEVHKYFKAAADSHIFKKGADINKILEGLDSLLDVFRMALHFEKDSVVLYQGMKQMVTENLGKKHIDKIIEEEMKHVANMQERIEQLA